ncbi:MAG: hypothetical protein FJX34_04400, partial [Alphaproteobacteria bacterium]|nr:hypothetical protein [Alphaproteobacteria bacterium]
MSKKNLPTLPSSVFQKVTHTTVPVSLQVNLDGTNSVQERVDALQNKIEYEAQPAFVVGKWARSFWDYLVRDADPSAEVMSKGLELFAEKNFVEAAIYFHEARVANPDISKAKVSGEMKEYYENSQRLLSKLRGLNLKAPLSKGQIGMLFVFSNQYEEAAEAFSAALKADP